MKRIVLALAALLLVGAPLTAAAQAPAPADYDWFGSRFKIKGNHVYNRSAVDTEERELTGSKTGFGAGFEIVLGNGLGFGLAGYTAGRVSEFDTEAAAVVVLTEANYFHKIRFLRLAPYAGINASLGTYTKAYFDDPSVPKFQDSLRDLGYQVGVRFQPFVLLGLDAQYRRVSKSAAQVQDGSFQRDQLIVGVTIF